MSLLEYKRIFLQDTAHYKKRGKIRTYKKLLEITNSEDVAVAVMVKELGYDPFDIKYMFTEIEYLKSKYNSNLNSSTTYKAS